jgi:hypothetical protein
MRLIVDSGSTKNDWIAIDDDGKVLFTTQTLGLNPEILESEQIIERLNDRFDIIQSKKKLLTFFLRCRLRYRQDEVRFVTSFSKLFLMQLSQLKKTYAAVYATTPKGQKSNCFYSRNRL